MKFLTAILTFLLLNSYLSAELKIPKGVLADPVPSAYDPKQTHALYVPSGYTPDKKWPILFCYEARSRGKIPVELFREAAERYGWIIFSSNHSRSDDPNAPNLEVLNAMWSDSHKWFSLDERRIYATGFSGGARLAWGMGYIYPKSTAGVIGVGAGFHEARPPSKETTFVWYGIAGNRDFNYLEMRKLEQQLAALQIPSRTEFFDGGHEWPPAEYCTRAVEWMELQAMKGGRRAKDPEWLRNQFENRLGEIRKLESSSSTFEAYEKYQHLKADFEGMLDLGDILEKIASLSNTEAIKKALSERQKRDEREQKHLDSFFQTLGGFRNSSEIPTTRKLKADLRVSQFQKEASKNGQNEDGILAQRLLEEIFVQTSFYLPEYFLGKKDFDRAIVSLSVASEIHSEYPWVWYSLAVAHMGDGDKKKTLQNLQIAIERGFKNKEWIDQEKTFDPIRNDPEFQKLLSRIAA
ncbi:hypothetical protein L0156_09110 [bacterium]|nr:hypothetical protein [bacterium]